LVKAENAAISQYRSRLFEPPKPTIELEEELSPDNI
jgi:hypothetical protein